MSCGERLEKWRSLIDENFWKIVPLSLAPRSLGCETLGSAFPLAFVLHSPIGRVT